MLTKNNFAYRVYQWFKKLLIEAYVYKFTNNMCTSPKSFTNWTQWCNQETEHYQEHINPSHASLYLLLSYRYVLPVSNFT